MSLHSEYFISSNFIVICHMNLYFNIISIYMYELSKLVFLNFSIFFDFICPYCVDTYM